VRVIEAQVMIERRSGVVGKARRVRRKGKSQKEDARQKQYGKNVAQADSSSRFLDEISRP